MVGLQMSYVGCVADFAVVSLRMVVLQRFCVVSLQMVCLQRFCGSCVADV